MIEKLDWAGYNLTTIVAKINEIIDTLSKPVIKYSEKEIELMLLSYTKDVFTYAADNEEIRASLPENYLEDRRKYYITKFIDDMRKLNGEVL